MNLRQIKNIEKKISGYDKYLKVETKQIPGLNELLKWVLYDDWENWKNAFIVVKPKKVLFFVTGILEIYNQNDILTWEECKFVLEKIIQLNFRFIGSEPYSCSKYYARCSTNQQKEKIRKIFKPYIENLLNHNLSPVEELLTINHTLREDEEVRFHYAQEYEKILKCINELSLENIDTILSLMEQQGCNSFSLTCLRDVFHKKYELIQIEKNESLNEKNEESLKQDVKGLNKPIVNIPSNRKERLCSYRMREILEQAKKQNTIFLKEYLEYIQFASCMEMNRKDLESNLKTLFKRLVIDDETMQFLYLKGQGNPDLDSEGILLLQEIYQFQEEMKDCVEDYEDYKELLAFLYQQLKDKLVGDYAYEESLLLQRRVNHE